MAKLRQIIQPLLPVAVIEIRARRRREREKQQEISRRQRFDRLKSVVGETVNSIRKLTETQCLDLHFLEHEFIPSLGLNDESLHEQPQEFSASYGKGLHIWQYPKQLAAYLVWLTTNVSEIVSYMEIGPRWGGMFILTAEWIRKHGGQLRSVVAVDPISPAPFIETYFELLRDQSIGAQPLIQAIYLRDLSTSQSVKEAVDRIRPDFVFIDGDHSLRIAFADHMLVREHAQIIVHHDVFSQSCRDTTFLWQALKKLESREFNCFDFVDQYSSIQGNFMGIGAMKRNTRYA